MPEQNLVRVEVTTAFFVQPDQVNDPEWRRRVYETQQALGALADSSADVALVVGLSFNGVDEADYDRERAALDRTVERQQALELASAGAVLAQDMTKLLIEKGLQAEKASKILGGKLKNDGIETVRSLLAVGEDQLGGAGMAGTYGPRSRESIHHALKAEGIFLPKAPPVEDVALFCESLEQVPGYVLLRIARAAEVEARAEHRERASSSAATVPDTDDDRFWLSEMWTTNLLRRSVAELSEIPVDDLDSMMVGGLRSILGSEQLAGIAEAARTLQRTAQQYAADFAAAKEAPEGGPAA